MFGFPLFHLICISVFESIEVTDFVFHFRWDETPLAGMTPQTPSMTPSSMTPNATPVGPKAMGLATPTPGHLVTMTPEQLQAFRWEREIDERNRPLADDELDSMFPPGYKVSHVLQCKSH
jgi:Splicing factor 3B subunit 1